MRNDPIFDDFDSTQQRFEMPQIIPQNILSSLQDPSTNFENSDYTGDFDIGQDSNDELPQLHKTSSELVHANKIQKKKNPQTYNYKMVGQRKKSLSGIDKSKQSKEKIAQFT